MHAFASNGTPNNWEEKRFQYHDSGTDLNEPNENETTDDVGAEFYISKMLTTAKFMSLREIFCFVPVKFSTAFLPIKKWTSYYLTQTF